MAKRQLVGVRMYAERCGDVPWRGHMSNSDQNGKAKHPGNAGNDAQRSRPSPNPAVFFGHCRTEQQCKCRVARHRVILLGGRKGEKNQNKTNPTESEQANPAGPVNRLEAKPADSSQIDAPWKEPDQMKEPEPDARYGVVIARVTQIQEA